MEKDLIIKEAEESKDVRSIAEKYNISVSTLYDWIAKKKANKNSKVYYHSLRFSFSEEQIFNEMLKNHGFTRKGNKSFFMKSRIFDKKFIVANPNDYLKELFSLRSELNKIGSNINQIANYYNYLIKNNILSEKKIETLANEINTLEDTFIDFKHVLNKVFKKEF